MASLFALLFVLPAGLDADDAIQVGDSAHFYGLEVPAEAAVGDEMPVTVYFGTDEALADDVHIFLHIQSQQSTCRMVRDEAPEVAEDGTIAHEFRVTIPDSPVCDPQRMEIYTGLYHRGRGGRFRVATTTDDRIHAGYFDIVDSGTSSPRAIAPSDMKVQKFMSLAQPFDWWLLGLLISVVMTVGLRLLGNRKGWFATSKQRIEDDGSGPSGDGGPEDAGTNSLSEAATETGSKTDDEEDDDEENDDEEDDDEEDDDEEDDDEEDDDEEDDDER